MATTPNYAVNYDDERLTKVEAEEKTELTEAERTYGEMIGGVDEVYNGLKESTEQWKNTETDIQNQQTDFTIQQIEQQKEQASKDYQKEQAGAYVDWRKQSNQYGSEAEKMASAGLANTGYSESSQVSMYNTYQNRVAVARESFNQAVLNYNNKITEAKLQNNAALAEIAQQAFEKEVLYTLQAFEYKNQLIDDLLDRKMQVKQFYADQWQNALNQINTEFALAEEVRQFNENQIWQTEQAELDRKHDFDIVAANAKVEKEMAAIQQGYNKELAEINQNYNLALINARTEADIKKAERDHELALEQLATRHEYDMAQLDKQLANEKALAKYKNDLTATTFNTGSGGSKSGYDVVNSVRFGNKTGNTSTKSGTTSSSSLKYQGKTVNMQSVTDLGYGPVSSAHLAQLISEGKVELYLKDGQYYAKHSPKYFVNSTKLGSKTKYTYTIPAKSTNPTGSAERSMQYGTQWRSYK